LAVKVNVARGLVDFRGGVEVRVVTGGTAGVAVIPPPRGARGFVPEPAGARVTPGERLLASGTGSAVV